MTSQYCCSPAQLALGRKGSVTLLSFQFRKEGCVASKSLYISKFFSCFPFNKINIDNYQSHKLNGRHAFSSDLYQAGWSSAQIRRKRTKRTEACSNNNVHRILSTLTWSSEMRSQHCCWLASSWHQNLASATLQIYGIIRTGIKTDVYKYKSH